MTNLLLALTSSIAVAVGVTFALGLAWIAVIIPMLASAWAGYGLMTLRRRRPPPRRSAERFARSSSSRSQA